MGVYCTLALSVLRIISFYDPSAPLSGMKGISIRDHNYKPNICLNITPAILQKQLYLVHC